MGGLRKLCKLLISERDRIMARDNHQSQYHFRRRGIPPPLPTLRVPPPELLLDQVQQRFVFQDLVGFLHPRFHQRFRFPGEEDLTQVALAMP